MAASKADTQRVKILNRLCRGYWRHSPDTSRIISQQALELAQKLDFTLGIANANNAIAISYYFQGNYVQAVEYYKKALASHQKIDNKRGVSRAYNNLGVLYSKKGDYAHSLEYYHKALVIQEELNDERLMAKSYNNIGNIYLDINEYPKALEFHQKALAIKRKLKASPSSMMYTYTNLGNVYKSMESYKEALASYRSALKICLTENLLKDAALSYTLMGFVMNFQNKLDSAIYYQKKSLEIARRDSLKNIELEVLYRLSFVYSRKKELKKAIDFGKQAVTLGLQNKEYPFVKDAAKVVADSYTQLKNYGQALKYQTIYLQSKDSLFNDNKTKELTRLEARYEFKKEMDSIQYTQQKQQVIHEAEIATHKANQRASYIGFGLTFLLILVLLFSYQQKQKSNHKLNKANESLVLSNQELHAVNESIQIAHLQIAKKNSDLMSSINYAKRIQTAMLPLNERMYKGLPNHFTLFRPRDVVSGDFYWFEEIDDKKFIVVADCTGHGVPGAFMTMLGSQALTNIIIQNKIYNPAEVLNHLDQIAQKLLKSKNTSVRDGMDITICVIDKGNRTLEFAGAKNPLLFIQNGEYKEIKGDIYSINGHRKDGKLISFTSHTLDINASTTIYMYSDGYQDQFGGKSKRKFMKKRFRTMLYENSNRPIEEQKRILETTLDNWMDGHEQIDDILVMGMKV
ncbi:hypothetical protein BKI52_02920 [marine bacterium AO1-C]|nr:hypothetical protein BKI52_02920 [marine bacterium AO1-C]